jgi:hypothetical protein
MTIRLESDPTVANLALNEVGWVGVDRHRAEIQ